MEEQYSTLTEAITAVFHREETSLLSLDKICQALQSPNLFLSTSNGMTPCSSISRRRISSILSSSDVFVRAGPPRSCMWALRPSNPLFLSDGALLSCISTILAENGPLTVKSIVEKGDLSGATVQIIRDFLLTHTSEYSICCKTTDDYYRYILQGQGSQIQQTQLPIAQDENGDDVWWFTGQPLPQRMEFESVISALMKAFELLNRDASIEEVSWVLCLSTLSQNKKISRRKISRELSRRPDLFQHISRAKYSLIKYPVKQPQQFVINCASLNNNHKLNSIKNNSSNTLLNNNMNFSSNTINNYSAHNFSASFSNAENNARNNDICPSNNLFVAPQIYNPTNNFFLQNPLQQSFPSVPFNDNAQPLSLKDISSSDFINEIPSKFEFISDWGQPVQQCETPPMINPNDFFDPSEFFSIGFSGTYE